MLYEILEEWNAEDLEASVRERMADGWRPLGGVSIARAFYDKDEDACSWYVQAMTKEDPKED